VIARSLAAALPPGPGRDTLSADLDAIPDNARDPLTRAEQLPRAGLGAPELALLRLLGARTPARYATVYRSLPAAVRSGLRRLSPLTGAARLNAPVEIASSPHDSYFPAAQYGPFLRAAPDARLTVTSALGHAVPRASLTDPGGLLGLDEFAVRSLRDLGPPVALNWLAVALSVAGLGLVAAQGVAGGRGLVGLCGLLALVAACASLPHATGLSPALAVSAGAAAAGVGVVVRTGKRSAPNEGVR
jgi:hypothetical protein